MKDKDQSNDKDNLNRGKFLKLWIIGIILLFTIFTGYMAYIGLENKQFTLNKISYQMNPNLTEPGLNAEDFILPANATPTRVVSGIYIDKIKELSFPDSYWTVDFWVWFKWNGSDVNPGETFEIVDGEILNKTLEDNYTNGTEHYLVYKVNSKITKFFDETRFPLDSHILTIAIEDGTNEREDLIYVADNATDEINKNIYVPGYDVGDYTSIIEKPHVYTSNFGDPRIQQGNTTYSQLRAGVDIHREDLGFYIRIFIGLFIAVAAALVALFIKPTFAEPRFGLGAGALFVAIANTIVTAGYIPKTGTITIADMINDLGLLLILVTLVQSTISLYIYDIKKEKEFSKTFDRYSFITLLAIYIVANVIIVISTW